MKRLIHFLLFLVATAIGNVHAAERIVISAPGPRNISYLPVDLIAKIGADKAEGVELQVIHTGGGAVALNNLVTGNADFAVAGMLVVTGFLGFWIDSLWISRELLPAGIHFLLVLLVIKLFNLQLRRDYLHLYAISLVAILAAASLTNDLWYLPIFLAYLLCAVWTLLLFQLTKKPEDMAAAAGTVVPMEGPAEPSRLVSPHLFWLTNGMAVATFGVTLIIFFAIPRVGGGFYQKGFGENIRTSGFSDRVDLGAMGPIKRDPSVVMRVEIPDRAGHETGRLYLRGVAFDRYDGRSWANEFSRRRGMSETTPGTFTFRRNHVARAGCSRARPPAKYSVGAARHAYPLCGALRGNRKRNIHQRPSRFHRRVVSAVSRLDTH